MQQREAKHLAEAAIGQIKHDEAACRRIAEKKNLLANNLARPRIEEGRLIAQMQAIDEARIRQFAEQCERFPRIDPLKGGGSSMISMRVLQPATR